MRALKLAARAPPRVNPLHDITGSDTLKMPFVASLRYMAAQYRNRRPHIAGIAGRSHRNTHEHTLQPQCGILESRCKAKRDHEFCLC